MGEPDKDRKKTLKIMKESIENLKEEQEGRRKGGTLKRIIRNTSLFCLIHSGFVAGMYLLSGENYTEDFLKNVLSSGGMGVLFAGLRESYRFRRNLGNDWRENESIMNALEIIDPDPMELIGIKFPKELGSRIAVNHFRREYCGQDVPLYRW